MLYFTKVKSHINTGGVDMIKHYFKLCSKMTLLHIGTQIFSLALCLFVFGVMLNAKAMWYFMSFATSVFYAITVYSSAYKIADKDTKRYSVHKPYIMKGLVITLPTIFITLILTALYDFSFYHEFIDYDVQMNAQFIIHNLFMAWDFTFEGFRAGADGTISVIYWLLSYALMPIASFLGYFAGMKHYDFGYKFFSTIVYKKK